MRRELPMILIGHANYPQVTHDASPASLSKKWITDILRKKIGYRGLIVSDDLEMGGVLKAAPIERATVEHIRAGGDLCLICHIEEYVVRSYEQLIEGSRERLANLRNEQMNRSREYWPLRKSSSRLNAGPPHPGRKRWKSFRGKYGSSAKKYAWPRCNA